MKKISKAKIVSTYANALYEAAQKTQQLARVKEDVEQLIPVLKADSSIMKNLANPLWKHDSKQEAIAAVAHKLKLSVDTINCLDILVSNNRFSELLAILEEFQHIWYQKNGYVEVNVQSAQALTSEQEKHLTANLEKMLSEKVVLNHEICPEILGGLIVKFGSSMIDDSIRGKLNRLENMMKGGQ